MVKRLSQLAIKYGLISALTRMAYGYAFLFRLQSVQTEMFDNHLREGKKAVVAMWHQRILAGMPHAMRYGSYAPAVMISQSRDGDMIADAYRHLKFHPIRGSSSRGGKKGLLAMVHYLRSHLVAVHVIDGPRGPAGVMKEGVITLAQHARAPIFPAYVSVSRAWVLSSWDRCLIPKPFSKVVLRYGEPIHVPEDLSPEAYEELRRNIEKRMIDNQRLDDAKFGHENLI